MKTTILISLLSLASIGSYAQDMTKDQPKTGACRHYAEMPKNATPAWPSSFSYISTQDPKCAPCYEYTTKHGLAVMECPGLLPLPEGATVAQTQGAMPAQSTAWQPNSSAVLDVNTTNSYTGNYPKACRRDPNMPKNAVPAWPKNTPYTSLTSPECAPCYEYTSKHGVKIMECPFLYFPAEK